MLSSLAQSLSSAYSSTWNHAFTIYNTGLYYWTYYVGDYIGSTQQRIDSEEKTEYEEEYRERWGLYVFYNSAIGSYLSCTKPIPAGSIVLEMRPTKLIPLSKIHNSNHVIQVDKDLFSSSEHEFELNNFISHSCEPNCVIKIAKDYTLYLITIAPIQPKEVITFDYETTEWDLVEQNAVFICKCGASSCRKEIKGRRYMAGTKHEAYLEK